MDGENKKWHKRNAAESNESSSSSDSDSQSPDRKRVKTDKMFRCWVCFQEFGTVTLLTLHIANHHDTVPSPCLENILTGDRSHRRRQGRNRRRSRNTPPTPHITASADDPQLVIISSSDSGDESDEVTSRPTRFLTPPSKSSSPVSSTSASSPSSSTSGSSPSSSPSSPACSSPTKDSSSQDEVFLFTCIRKGCSYMASDWPDLQIHRLTQHEEQFACDPCQVTFRYQGDLNRHFKTKKCPFRAVDNDDSSKTSGDTEIYSPPSQVASEALSDNINTHDHDHDPSLDLNLITATVMKEEDEYVIPVIENHDLHLTDDPNTAEFVAAVERTLQEYLGPGVTVSHYYSDEEEEKEYDGNTQKRDGGGDHLSESLSVKQEIE